LLPIRAEAQWLACTDEICVPERGTLALDLPIGVGAPDEAARFDQWRRALPRPLGSPATFAVDGQQLRVAIPLPHSVAVDEPYLFPSTENAIDYAAAQRFRRSGDTLVAELPLTGAAPQRFAGVLALADGTGLALDATPGAVPSGGRLVGDDGWRAIALAILGALAGGLLLNFMPCVFPILALKALTLARAGGGEREARQDALGYLAGAVIGTGALGIALLVIRAGGTAAGWAFQLQDPRVLLVLMLLATAITLNLLGLFRLPVIGGEASPRGGFATGALAAFVATPCAGPFLGVALGTALLLPAYAAVLVFASLGLGLALPFLAIAFIPALRNRLPRPGPWMAKLQRILAVPMALTVAACLWLLWRQGGASGLVAAVIAAGLLTGALLIAGQRQRQGEPAMALPVILLLVGAFVPLSGLGRGEMAVAAKGLPSNAEAWSPALVEQYRTQGRKVFVYFTADWCLSCKVNEAGAINRESVQRAFRQHGVKVVAGDWTNGDPEITRLLDSKGRAAVPLYLWYEPGEAEPEELPQVLTPGMLTSRAERGRS
jgi:thiol:disulfide interchange protein